MDINIIHNNTIFVFRISCYYCFDYGYVFNFFVALFKCGGDVIYVYSNYLCLIFVTRFEKTLRIGSVRYSSNVRF